MQTLHLSEPGLHASCFLLKSVKGLWVLQARQSTTDPRSFSTQSMQRSMPARRRSWLMPNDEVVFTWQQETQRTTPSPAAGATREGGAATVPSLMRHNWHTSLEDLASWLREYSDEGFRLPQTVHVMAPLADAPCRACGREKKPEGVGLYKRFCKHMAVAEQQGKILTKGGARKGRLVLDYGQSGHRACT